MGGRGSSSKGASYQTEGELVLSISASQDDSAKFSIAKQLMRRAEKRKSVSILQDGMTHPENFKQAQVKGVTVNFLKGSTVAPEAIQTISDTLDIIPKAISKHTKSITLTSQAPVGGGDALATAGDGDGNITVYNGNSPSALTIIHESIHNFHDAYFTGYNELDASPFYDAVNSGEQTPYPQGNGSLEEDFAESTALYLTDKANFTRDYPLRAAAVQAIINAAQSEGGYE